MIEKIIIYFPLALLIIMMYFFVQVIIGSFEAMPLVQNMGVLMFIRTAGLIVLFFTMISTYLLWKEKNLGYILSFILFLVFFLTNVSRFELTYIKIETVVFLLGGMIALILRFFEKIKRKN